MTCRITRAKAYVKLIHVPPPLCIVYNIQLHLVLQNHALVVELYYIVPGSPEVVSNKS